MDYGMIGKIEKAKYYAEERDHRIQFDSLRASINGDNGDHKVAYEDGVWHCDCDFFNTRNVCSHTMALERVLRNMVEVG